MKIEIPVDGYDAGPWNGVSEYCLYRENGEAFANGKHKALIVMATGTGKTHATMVLIDVFMRPDQVRRVLFSCI